ncbi:hypothetical protein PAHAL_5G094500 [Panicum hallii]|uniref:Uncharacterized protein n=1 Tax=Panicum hallii TaxID=206008 RepID=A0A2T8IJF9_9POAL|nr:hypothetical protein PAHAL_5G094500 [Panicum hallii]
MPRPRPLRRRPGSRTTRRRSRTSCWLTSTGCSWPRTSTISSITTRSTPCCSPPRSRSSRSSPTSPRAPAGARSRAPTVAASPTPAAASAPAAAARRRPMASAPCGHRRSTSPRRRSCSRRSCIRI